jgi:hypothetical protein
MPALAFHLFPGGNPPADTDKFIISRADPSSPSGFSQFLLTWAEIKAAIGVAPSSSSSPVVFMVDDGEDGEDGFPIPGPQGVAGVGIPGATGRDGAVMLPDDPADPEEPFMIPGRDGINGINGINGTNATTIFIAEEPDDPDEPLMIPGPQGPAGAGAGSDPFIGSYAPGSFTIPDREYVVMGHELELTGTQEVTINGDGSLVIVG